MEGVLEFFYAKVLSIILAKSWYIFECNCIAIVYRRGMRVNAGPAAHFAFNLLRKLGNNAKCIVHELFRKFEV